MERGFSDYLNHLDLAHLSDALLNLSKTVVKRRRGVVLGGFCGCFFVCLGLVGFFCGVTVPALLMSHPSSPLSAFT